MNFQVPSFQNSTLSVDRFGSVRDNLRGGQIVGQVDRVGTYRDNLNNNHYRMDNFGTIRDTHNDMLARADRSLYDLSRNDTYRDHLNYDDDWKYEKKNSFDLSWKKNDYLDDDRFDDDYNSGANRLYDRLNKTKW